MVFNWVLICVIATSTLVDLLRYVTLSKEVTVSFGNWMVDCWLLHHYIALEAFRISKFCTNTTIIGVCQPLGVWSHMHFSFPPLAGYPSLPSFGCHLERQSSKLTLRDLLRNNHFKLHPFAGNWTYTPSFDKPYQRSRGKLYGQEQHLAVESAILGAVLLFFASVISREGWSLMSRFLFYNS